MSRQVDQAKDEILRLAKPFVPTARVEGIGTRDGFYCTLIVQTDAEKQRINSDSALLDEMIAAAGSVGRRPDGITAESQETVDRRYGGDWNHVFR